MGAATSKRLPPSVDPLTLRRLGGACFEPEAFLDVADPDTGAVPRERVLAEVARRGLDAHNAIFWANLRHFFTVRRGLDGAWAAVPNRRKLETGIEAFDRLKKQTDKRRATAARQDFAESTFPGRNRCASTDAHVARCSAVPP